MTHSSDQARLEADISRLHRAVHQVHVQAMATGQQGLADDMWLLLVYVGEIGGE